MRSIEIPEIAYQKNESLACTFCFLHAAEALAGNRAVGSWRELQLFWISVHGLKFSSKLRTPGEGKWYETQEPAEQ